MKSIDLFIILFILGLLTSCGKHNGIYKSSANRKAGIAKISQFTGDQGTFLWSHYDITKRASIVYISPDGEVRMLSENPPDAALQSINSISGKLKIKSEIDAKTLLSTQKSIAEMGKRTASVNMLRDALYRLNEMYYSSELINKEFLKTLEKIYFDSIIITDKNNNFYHTKLFKHFHSNDLSSLKNIFPENGLNFFNSSSSNEMFERLYKEILNTVKDISIIEADVSIQEYKVSIEQAKVKQMKLEMIKEIISKTDSTFSKKEMEKILNKLIEN